MEFNKNLQLQYIAGDSVYYSYTPEVVQDLCFIYRRLKPKVVDVKGVTHSLQTRKQNNRDVGSVTAQVLQTNRRQLAINCQQNVLRILKQQGKGGHAGTCPKMDVGPLAPLSP